jgi:uncharacterized protein (DUF983 family)
MTVQITTPGNAELEERSLGQAMRRGLTQCCPACGEGKLYKGYLKVADTCASCHEELYHQRADDAPPYVTMSIVGHIIGAGVMTLESLYAPSFWVHAVIWAPLTLGMSLWMLPRVKGSLVGLQWAFRMHGFGGKEEDTGAPEAAAAAAI